MFLFHFNFSFFNGVLNLYLSIVVYYYIICIKFRFPFFCMTFYVPCFMESLKNLISYDI